MNRNDGLVRENGLIFKLRTISIELIFQPAGRLPDFFLGAFEPNDSNGIRVVCDSHRASTCSISNESLTRGPLTMNRAISLFLACELFRRYWTSISCTGLH